MKLASLLILIAVGFALAQPVKEPKLAKTCIWPDAPHHNNTMTWGVGAGVTQGLGIHFRKWFDHHGFNLSLFPSVDLSEEQKDVELDFGANYMFALWESNMYEFAGYASRNLVYAYGGGHVYYQYFRGEEHMDWSQMHYEEKTIFLGGGLGLQMNLGAIQFSGGLGFAAYRRDYNDYDPWLDSYSENELSYVISPSLDVSMGYTFGWK